MRRISWIDQGERCDARAAMAARWLASFEKLPLKQAVAGVEPIETNPEFYRQLNLFELPAQAVDATQALNRSAGVSKPKVLRGRSLSWRATWLRRSCVYTDKSVPFGKYCRSRPLVFYDKPPETMGEF
jgi:hypothetical protein